MCVSPGLGWTRRSASTGTEPLILTSINCLEEANEFPDVFMDGRRPWPGGQAQGMRPGPGRPRIGETGRTPRPEGNRVASGDAGPQFPTAPSLAHQGGEIIRGEVSTAGSNSSRNGNFLSN